MTLILACAAVCSAAAADYSMAKLDDRAPDGHVEIQHRLWPAGRL